MSRAQATQRALAKGRSGEGHLAGVPVEAPPDALSPAGAQLPADRKRSRALWALGQHEANAMFKTQRFLDDNAAESEIEITVSDETGCALGEDTLFYDLRQGASTLFGSVFHHANIDYMSGYALKYTGSDGRPRWLRDNKQYDVFVKDMSRCPRRTVKRSGGSGAAAPRRAGGARAASANGLW